MLFILSKVLWAFTSPGAILLWLLVIGMLLGKRRAGRWFTTIGTLGFVAIVVLPVSTGMMAPLENRFPPPNPPPAHVDGIIVLGGAIDLGESTARGIPSLNDAAERMTAFVTLARKYPDARLIFTGGEGTLEHYPLTEADVARRLFGDLGLDIHRVVFEDQSRNTFENAIYSKRLMQPKPGETWLLITSAWHMPRSVGIFRAAGWPVVAWPVGYKTGGGEHFSLTENLGMALCAAHEWIGMAAYRLLGRTDTLFPGP